MENISKHPFTNAVFATLYIVVIVFVIQLFTSLKIPDNTILIPMTMLSLFVLSAAVMGFLFISEPILLCFENKRKEAVTFFLKTVGFFAGFVVLFIAVLVSTSFY